MATRGRFSVIAPEYYATVGFGPMGSIAAIATVLDDEPLAGRGLIEWFAVTLDHGLRVVVEPLRSGSPAPRTAPQPSRRRDVAAVPAAAVL